MRWQREDLAWLAGLYEGEGSFVLRAGRYPSVTIASSDLDVLERVQRITGMGGICVQRAVRAQAHWKPMWAWQVTRSEHAIALMAALYPWLLIRRQERVREVLVAFKALPRRSRGEWCRCGRRRTIRATDGRYACLPCDRDLHRAKRKAVA